MFGHTHHTRQTLHISDEDLKSAMDPYLRQLKIQIKNPSCFSYLPLALLHLCHPCFILSDLKCYESATSGSRSSLKCKVKGEMKKQQAKKKLFNLQNAIFFLFLLFGTLLLSKFLTFSFLVHFIRFKMLQEHHLQFSKSPWNCNSKRATYTEFLGCLGTGFVVFCGLFFSVLDPSMGREGGVTFSFLIRF